MQDYNRVKAIKYVLRHILTKCDQNHKQGSAVSLDLPHK